MDPSTINLIFGIVVVLIFIFIIIFTIVLKVKNRNKTVEKFYIKNKPCIVLTYAEWCPHSTKALDNWRQMENSLNKDFDIDMFTFEDSKNPQACKLMATKPGFMGYPDIRYFPRGYTSPYNIMYKGDRNTESLIIFVKSKGKFW